jgi:hypothetical protein
VQSWLNLQAGAAQSKSSPVQGEQRASN